jgi:hypothetical protein
LHYRNAGAWPDDDVHLDREINVFRSSMDDLDDAFLVVQFDYFSEDMAGFSSLFKL